MTKVKTITSLPEISVGIEINQSEFAPVHYFHTCPGYRVAKMIGGAVQVRNEMSKIMTQLRIDENIAKVIGQMLESQISGIPIVDALHRTLADILTASDGEETLADAEICKTISARLDAKGGIPDALINLKVHDGVVVFRGVIPKQHQRQMLCAIAESVPGVRTVHDHLDVSSRTLMGHSYRGIRRMRYGTGSSWERHNDRAAVFRVKRLEGATACDP